MGVKYTFLYAKFISMNTDFNQMTRFSRLYNTIVFTFQHGNDAILVHDKNTLYETNDGKFMGCIMEIQSNMSTKKIKILS